MYFFAFGETSVFLSYLWDTTEYSETECFSSGHWSKMLSEKSITKEINLRTWLLNQHKNIKFNSECKYIKTVPFSKQRTAVGPIVDSIFSLMPNAINRQLYFIASFFAWVCFETCNPQEKHSDSVKFIHLD